MWTKVCSRGFNDSSSGMSCADWLWMFRRVTLSVFLSRVLRAVHHCSAERVELLQQSLWEGTDRSEWKHLCKCHMCRNGAFITTCSWRDVCVCRALHLWGLLLVPWRSRCLQSCCVTLWWISHRSSFSNRDLEQMQLIWHGKIQEKQISTTVFVFVNPLTEGKFFASVSFSCLLKSSCLSPLHVVSFWNWRRVITATEKADRSPQGRAVILCCCVLGKQIQSY